MTYFLIGLGVILAYLIASISVGIVLGIREYFKIKVGSLVEVDGLYVNMKPSFNRGLFKSIMLDCIIAVFYNRFISAILAIIFYPLKAWSRNIVYNHFFRNNFRTYMNWHNTIKFYSLKNDKFKNGFYAMSRNKGSVSKNYKSKNMIVGYRDDTMAHILFPIAFMIWLYSNDSNPFDMAGLNKGVYHSPAVLKSLRKYILDENIGKDKGSYLEVGDNLIKEPAYISFLVNRIFIYEHLDINIKLYYN